MSKRKIDFERDCGVVSSLSFLYLVFVVHGIDCCKSAGFVRALI